MDFDLSEAQQAVAEAAAKLFEGELTDQRRQEVDAGAGGGLDKALWASLADANLLGLAVSEEDGGSGLGFTEVAVLLEEAGRTAAPVPLWPTLVLGAMPVASYGSPELRRRLLPPVVRGEMLLTAALVEDGNELDEPATEALLDGPVSEGAGWRISGSKTCVPAGTVAQAVLVSARSPQGLGLFVVDTGAAGVSVTPLETTTGTPEARIDFDAVEVGADGVLASPPAGDEVLEWLLARASAGLCSMIAGACQSAVKLTSEYAASRQQFGRVIATFQAVSQRAADSFVDAEAVLLTSRQAAWRLGEGLPSAEQVAIAKFWAAEGGQRVVHAAQHIHGGVGVDRSYPLHRYFLLAKQLELTLGGATESLLRLGSIMAEEGPGEF